MEDWFTGYKIPLGKWISGFVDLLNEHAAFLFNATSDGLGFLIDGLIDLMQALRQSLDKLAQETANTNLPRDGRTGKEAAAPGKNRGRTRQSA